MAVKSVFGQIQEFDPSSDLFTVYMERVNLVLHGKRCTRGEESPSVFNYYREAYIRLTLRLATTKLTNRQNAAKHYGCAQEALRTNPLSDC